MCDAPTYNQPAQPSYGEGMADAMKAQMEQLPLILLFPILMQVETKKQ